MELIKTRLGDGIPQSSKSLLEVIDSGFCSEKQQCTKKPNISTNTNTKSKHKDSILNSVDTGFGGENFLIKDCPKPKYKIPLYKENYLSEFTNDIEKALVRKNLGIYDNDEIINIIKDLIGKDTGGFITKLELNNTLSDFVKSELKSYANYEIPDKLFQL